SRAGDRANGIQPFDDRQQWVTKKWKPQAAPIRRRRCENLIERTEGIAQPLILGERRRHEQCPNAVGDVARADLTGLAPYILDRCSEPLLHISVREQHLVEIGEPK